MNALERGWGNQRGHEYNKTNTPPGIVTQKSLCSCNCILVFRSSDKRMQERVGIKATGNHENENETRLLEIKHIRKKHQYCQVFGRVLELLFLLLVGKQTGFLEGKFIFSLFKSSLLDFENSWSFCLGVLKAGIICVACNFYLNLKCACTLNPAIPLALFAPRKKFAYVNSETFTEVSIAVSLMNKTLER